MIEMRSEYDRPELNKYAIKLPFLHFNKLYSIYIYTGILIQHIKYIYVYGLKEHVLYLNSSKPPLIKGIFRVI